MSSQIQPRANESNIKAFTTYDKIWDTINKVLGIFAEKNVRLNKTQQQ